MSVGFFCNREVVVTKPDATIVEVAALMRHHHVGDVVVVEQREDLPIPVGIVTDRDIVVELIATEIPFATVTIRDIMNDELITVQEEDGIWDTLQRMRHHGIRRVPVVNDRGGLEGILTVDDLLELLAEEMGALAGIIGREIGREREQRE